MTKLGRTQSTTDEGRASWISRLGPGQTALVCLGLALAVVLVFLPVTRHGFVNYDDLEYVTQNSHVQAGLTWESARWAFQTGHASNWHPLTWFSHMLDCQFYGLKAGGHHLTNLLFHVVNTVLVFLVLKRMTGAIWRSVFVAALFGLHPLHVESVAWISERKDVLSTLFWLLTLWAYTQYAGKCEVRSAKYEDNKTDSREPRSAIRIASFYSRVTRHPSLYYNLALVCFALGLMSKPMLVTLPFVLLLLDYWPLKRFQLGTLKLQLPTARRLIAEKLPFFALALASSVVTFAVQRKGGAVSSLDVLPLGSRFANALVSYVRYLRKTFWPDDLSVLYPHPGHWPWWQVGLAGLLLVCVTVAAIWLARRRPYLTVGWLWFVGTLVPVIGLVQVGIQSMADRYTYVPLIGVFVMLAWGMGELTAGWRVRRPALAVGSALVLICCGGVTRAQVGYWNNSETLFRRAVKVTKDNYLAYNNLGFYLFNQGRVEEAMTNYQMSLHINPNYEDALNNLGHALAEQGKYAEALPYYEAALRIKPNHAEVHNNLGNALANLGQVDEGIAHYWIALRQKPDHADAHNNLGVALAMKGQSDEAIHHFEEAIRLKPKNASAHSNWGNTLAGQRKFDEAIEHYLISLQIKPDEAQAHNNLANVLVEKGRLDEAVKHYEEALKLNSKNPEAHFNLGLALLRQGKRDEAAAHFSEALRLKPDYAEAQRQLRALTNTLPANTK